MPIKLENVVGINYFAIFPKDKYDAVISIANSAKALQTAGTEAEILNMQIELGDCIGIKEAERLKSFIEIEEAALEERSRLERVKTFHDEFIGKAISAAQDRIVSSNSEYNQEDEMHRDLIFYTLARSGILLLSNTFGIEVDEYEATEAILRGEPLGNYLPNGFRQTDMDLFILGIKNSARRTELTETFNIKFEFGEEKSKHLDENLLKRYGGLSDSLREKVGTGLMYLWNGQTDLQDVISWKYLNEDHIPLAYLITQNVPKQKNIQYFHTTTRNNIDYVDKLLSGHIFRQEALRYISDLTDIDGFEHVTVWRTHIYDIIGPEREIQDDVWGSLYGMIRARLSGERLGLHNTSKEEVQSEIERLGKLNKNLETSVSSISSIELRKGFNQEGTEDRTIHAYSTNIPQHIINLNQSVNPEYVSPEFARHSLLGYAKLRGNPSFTGHELHVPFKDVEMLRTLGKIAGVNIGDGTIRGNRLRVYLPNINL